MAITGTRKSRNSIPKVNVNPAQRVNKPYQAKVTPAKPVTHRALAPSKALTTRHVSNTPTGIPQTQSEAVNPFQATSTPAPNNPNELFPIPAYTPGAGEEDPRDATYWANLAKLRFNSEQDYAKILREQTGADSEYADAVQTAIRQRAQQQRGLGEDAIRGNLGNSGWLNRNEAEQTSEYTQGRARAQLSKDQEDQARAAARNALLQGYPIETAILWAEAGGRYGERKQGEAQNAPGDPAPPAAAAVGTYAGKGKKKYGIDVGNALPNRRSGLSSGVPLAPVVRHSPVKAALNNHKKKGKR